MVSADFMGGGTRERTGSQPRAIFGCNYETPLALLEDLQVGARCPALREDGLTTPISSKSICTAQMICS